MVRFSVTSRWFTVLSLILAVRHPAADAITTIDGVRFVDRGGSGEIALGNIRGGLAVLDFDRDDWPDLVIRDSAGRPSRLFHNRPEANRPDGRTFVDVTAGSGLDDADGTARSGFGVVAVDYDNDGYPDVFMTGGGGPGGSYGLLYRNNRDGTFANVSEASGVRGTGRSPESVSCTDYDLDGWVDLFMCFQNGSPFRLLRNNRDGTFSDAGGLLPAVPASNHIYAHMWMDYDHDGYADCFVLINSGGPPVLLRNVADGNGGRRFINAAASAGFTRLGPAPMGIAAGDYDGDGHLDLAITDASVGTYYRNLGSGLVEVFPFRTFFGWGVTWIDVDNDGDVDNYYVGSYANPNHDRLMRNLGNGQWADVSAALNTVSLSSQHSVQVDFNNDGRQDLVTINPGSPGLFVSVYENLSTTGNHWLKVKLAGNGATVNRDAIGAVVRLTAGGVTQVREVISGSSTTATEDLRLHFGLGQSTAADRIEVIWPRKGALATRTDVYDGPFAADQILTLTAPPPAAGDWDRDGDVDLADFQLFRACITGPGLAQKDPSCRDADLDADGDVDQTDFGLFQRCISGSDRRADSACAA
ncbi:MAG: hypothetical protein AMXMBFR83_15200 [Phycisphaerae bacterium]